MALTKADLAAIRKVVREEVETEVKDSSGNLENQIRLSRMELQNNIRDVDRRVKNVEARVENVSKDVQDVKKRVKKIEKNVDLMVRVFDTTDIELAKRVNKSEKHLGFAPEN